jgi:predicted Fe-Mo cluster-binding NifX family protein
LKDVVSNVFGRARTFTIVDIENGKIDNVIVMENSLSYLQGAGPIVVQTLVDKGVDVLLTNKLGHCTAEQLMQRNISHVQVKPGTNVREAIKKVLHTHK